MSDADYHEGYFEGVRNCYQALYRIRNAPNADANAFPALTEFRRWIEAELDDARIIRDHYAKEYWKRDEE